MRNRFLLVVAATLLFVAGVLVGSKRNMIVLAQNPAHSIPKSYGHVVSSLLTDNGAGLVFEDSQGVIRYVSLDGKLWVEIPRN